MLNRTAHLHEFLDDTGRRYLVRLNVGMRMGVVQCGPLCERIEWRGEWGVYRPNSDATAERIVAEFVARQARLGSLEPINDELAAIAGPQPKRKPDVHERQLPVSDRA